VVLPAVVLVEYGCHQSHPAVIKGSAPVVMPADDPQADPFERLLRDNPLAALAEAREKLVREHRDYTCTFVRQERLSSGMTAEQEIEVKFRAEPYSVMMNWTRNRGMIERVIYIKDKWINERARNPGLRQLALAQPSSLAGLFIKSIKQPIHGIFARRSSRHSIDQFGFEQALDLLIKYCRQAQATGELKLSFEGKTRFAGRPVWLIRRQLPYSGEAGPYPDRVADIYLDREYLVPTAVYCYSDDERKSQDLLGKYEYYNVRFDVGLTDGDFDPAPYGM
jgi:hypothetical protein